MAPAKPALEANSHSHPGHFSDGGTRALPGPVCDGGRRGRIRGVISVEEALDRILSRVAPLGGERVALPEALHRVLDEDVDSPRDMPPWPASSMDGYALRGEDTDVDLTTFEIVYS